MEGNLHVPFLGGLAGVISPGYPAPIAEEQRKVAVLYFLRRQTGRHGQAEIMHHPLVEALGTIGELRFQKRDIISYSILGHRIPQKWVFLD